MEKKMMVSIASSRLDQLGVSYKRGKDSDVSISCEFETANNEIECKKINYFANIYFNERIKTVFMWEIAKERGERFPFSKERDTCDQVLETLFLKVKSTEYGFNGKVYEHIVDLCKISKIFKEVAKENGWNFKRVLKREKALYPLGYFEKGEKHHRDHIVKGNIYIKDPLDSETKKQGIVGTEHEGILELRSKISEDKDKMSEGKDKILEGTEKVLEVEKKLSGKDNKILDTENDKLAELKNSIYWILFFILFVFDLLVFVGGARVIFLVGSLFILGDILILKNKLSTGIKRMLIYFLVAFLATVLIFAIVGVRA